MPIETTVDLRKTEKGFVRRKWLEMLQTANYA
jgi:hypothetical protein